MRVDRSLQLLLKVVCFAAVSVDGFSFNINAKTVFRPRDGMSNDHSYFGYSVLLRDGAKPMIIVGAPQDSIQHSKYRDIKDSGAIYYCQISNNGTEETCIQKIVDSSGNERQFKANGKSYHHRKDSMWLGMSIDGTAFNNGTVVMCAPRWINQYHYDYYLANGLCYSVADTLKPFDISNTAILMPLIDQDNQGFLINNPVSQNAYGSNVYFYAYGQAGISTKLSDNGGELLIGAPGVLVWKGTVIRYKISKQYTGQDYFLRQPVVNPYFTSEIKDDGYFGYSVGFGKFSSTKSMLYVAGAPRSSDYKGDVIIFDFPAKTTDKYVILAKFEGKQIGEYFGSVIATIDINQDGLTDLLIGAPMHSEPLTWDQGKVYVYINQDNFQFKEQEATIGGSFREGGRFGSSISEIGDINEDGFLDVAIGSPYEEYGRGAIYIYLGTKDGLNQQYTQRIVVDKTEGFGISISKGVDVDKNTCNDIAVGAYTSRKVILLKCHPSVHVTSKIETTPTELSLNLTSFTVQTCFQFTGNKAFTTDIEAHIFVDTNYKRASIESRSEKIIIISGKGGTENCKDVIVDIESALADFSRPIDLKMTYNLKRNPMNEPKFCPECTVLRPTEKKELIYQVPFVSGCVNLTCQPDLKLNIDLLTETPYVIGSTKSLKVKISLENTGEPAYIAKTKMFLSEKLPIAKIPLDCKLGESDELICDFDNPLHSLSKKSLILEFDTSLLTSLDEMLNFNITAVSGGEEVTPEDNNAVAQLQLKSFSKVDVLGSSGNNEFIYIENNVETNRNVSNISIIHSYDILNSGPTIVDLFKVTFYLPVEFHDVTTKEKLNLIKVLEPVGYLNGQPLICNPAQGNYFEPKKEGHAYDFTNDTTEIYLTTTESVTDAYSTENILETTTPILEDVVKNSDKNSELIFNSSISGFSNSIYLNCSAKDIITCMKIQCSASELNIGSNGVHVVLNMLVNVSTFDKILKDKYVGILSTFSTVKPSRPNIEWESFGFVNSFILHSDPPPAPVSLWIYILAFVLGILLLAVLIFVFYKFGFFRRKTREELELLKDQDLSSTETLEQMDIK